LKKNQKTEVVMEKIFYSIRYLVILNLFLMILFLCGCSLFQTDNPAFNNSTDEYGYADYYEKLGYVNAEPELL